MSERVAAPLARASQEVEAARTLAAAGFAPQSVSRAYYAAFYGAEAALLAIGETRSKHSGVIAAFGQLVVKQGGIDPDAGRTLRRLFELRNAADYFWLDADDSTSGDPITDAEKLIDAVSAWVGTLG